MKTYQGKRPMSRNLVKPNDFDLVFASDVALRHGSYVPLSCIVIVLHQKPISFEKKKEDLHLGLRYGLHGSHCPIVVAYVARCRYTTT